MFLVMLETEPALCEVVGQNNNHLWLEILESGDKGIRVSVPHESSKYGEEFQQAVLSLSVGDKKTIVLKSEEEDRPEWFLSRIGDLENDRSTELPA